MFGLRTHAIIGVYIVSHDEFTTVPVNLISTCKMCVTDLHGLCHYKTTSTDYIYKLRLCSHYKKKISLIWRKVAIVPCGQLQTILRVEFK